MAHPFGWHMWVQSQTDLYFHAVIAMMYIIWHIGLSYNGTRLYKGQYNLVIMVPADVLAPNNANVNMADTVEFHNSQFLSKYSQETLHSSPSRVSYGVSLVSFKSYLCYPHHPCIMRSKWYWVIMHCVYIQTPQYQLMLRNIFASTLPAFSNNPLYYIPQTLNCVSESISQVINHTLTPLNLHF